MNKQDKLTGEDGNFYYGEFWSGDIKLGYKSIEPPTTLLNKIILMAEELQVVRDYIGSPIHITSAYRTIAWNRHEGGVKNSYHTQGIAVDIRVNGMTPGDLGIYVAKLTTEFRGYVSNIKKNFLRIDMRPTLMVFKY